MVDKTQNTADQTLNLFDEVFGRIPSMYRQSDPDVVIDTSKKGKKKKSKDAGLSLADLNERAQAKIEENRRVNAEKSQKKIAELTKMHKEQGLGIHAKKNLATEEAQSSDSGDEEMKEESKTKTADKPKKEKVFENKHTVAKSKLKNKRAVKEALKKNKQKRQKGTTKDAAEEVEEADEKMASGSDTE